MPKIDSMNAMANTASITTEFASAFSTMDIVADTFATFARPINDYEVEVKRCPASQQWLVCNTEYHTPSISKVIWRSLKSSISVTPFAEVP